MLNYTCALFSQARELNERLHNRSITLILTDAALDYVVSQSYDQLYGARPLRRWLEKHVVTQLSVMIVGGELDEGAEVTVDAAAGGAGLEYRVKKGEGSPASGEEKLGGPVKRARLAGLDEGLDDEDMLDALETEK